jgi:hypothetical protein
MSYIIGRQYVWVDASHLHIWSDEGYDGWDESSWAKGFEPRSDRRSAAFGLPGGVSLRQKVADEYVVMRMAELVATGEAGAVIDRALASHGANAGCQALVQHAPSLRAALPKVR